MEQTHFCPNPTPKKKKKKKKKKPWSQLRTIFMAATSAAAAAAAAGRGRRKPRGGGLSTLVAAVVVAAAAVVLYTHAPVRGANQSLLGRRDVACDGESAGGPQCAPAACARVVRDGFASPEEVAVLASLVRDATRLGRGAGGATVFDPVSGALSRGQQFIDAYAVCKAVRKDNKDKSAVPAGCPVSAEALRVYARVAARIRAQVTEVFRIPSPPQLTAPSFVSMLTAADAVTEHDEYWHEHVDRRQYGSFEYTALLYLSEGGGKDFEGGEFTFVDAGVERDVVVPRPGRLLLFTSGGENAHRVRQVRNGTRLAMTIAFTCDQDRALDIDSFLDGRIADALEGA
jgi:hypothetical protein